MIGDLRYAWRTLWKSPIFTLTAAVTIALGIGSVTAIFSVTHAVLMRPLPYKDADRLVDVCSDMRRRNVRDFPFSNANFIDLRDGAKKNFEDFAAITTFQQVTPKEDGTPEQLHFAAVTPNFLKLLGGRIVAGRDFEDEDGRAPAPPPANAAAGLPAAAPAQLPTVAILSYSYWQHRYGGNPNVIGKNIVTPGGGGPQIVGVLAPGFELLFPTDFNVEPAPDIWIASRLAYDAANRMSVSLVVIGKLKAGSRMEQAQAEVDGIAATERQITPIMQTAGFAVRLEPMHQYLVADVRPVLLALTGAVIFLMLIACANVANLLLVRTSLRQRELAVRAAIGGNAWQLLRQMMVEALLLSAMGTAAGLALAWVGIRELLAVAPLDLPRLESVSIDPAVVGFAALAGLASALLFGLIPAVRAARPDLMNVLRSSMRTMGPGSGRLLRSGVVIAEVALCFVLLIGSGLMIRSFIAIENVDPGFDSHGLLSFIVLDGTVQNKPEARAARQRAIAEALRGLPGETGVTASTPFPLAGGFFPIRWGTEAALTDPSKFQAVDNQTVLPGYFETLRTPLLAGRTFTEADNSPDRAVAIVDEVLAAKAYPGQSAIGKRILIRVRTPQPEWVEIIGVVRHQHDTSLAAPGREQIYFTDGFLSYGVAGLWAIRTAGDPNRLVTQVRSRLANLDKQLLVTEIQPMDALVDKAQAGTRFALVLIGVFAVIAALLAAVGLYGVLATVVRQRTSEIGLRMALGAVPRHIFRLVVGHGLRLSGIGLVAGTLGALAFGRAMASMLVGVKPTDPATFVGMALLFALIAAVASWIPARRAASLDPSKALHEE